MDATSTHRIEQTTPEEHQRIDQAIAADARVEKAAKRWYKAFRSVAYQTPLPMVVSDPKWSQLPTWYRDLLIAAMHVYLSDAPDAHKE